jgi:hypothetical protein
MIFAILNILAAIWLWSASARAFEVDYDKVGWILIFASAFNAAVGLDYFVP